ncbi:CesT family type III secretion system chaperone [Piscinibacter sp.]|uniref:CesT family type III secretion system chaperone n=1 Tax=Piscinibacter sp. TaxID=1903157 RepID=UPI00391F1F3D
MRFSVHLDVSGDALLIDCELPRISGNEPPAVLRTLLEVNLRWHAEGHGWFVRCPDRGVILLRIAVEASVCIPEELRFRVLALGSRAKSCFVDPARQAQDGVPLFVVRSTTIATPRIHAALRGATRWNPHGSWFS